MSELIIVFLSGTIYEVMNERYIYISIFHIFKNNHENIIVLNIILFYYDSK